MYVQDLDWFTRKAGLSFIQTRNVLSSPISVIILFHREYATLNSTLRTWEDNGLIQYMNELIIFMNGMTTFEKDEFFDKLPRLKSLLWKNTDITLLNSEANIPLGSAIGNCTQEARNELVLLLEKDWALVESGTELRQTLSSSVSLLQNGVADVVRLRHRHKPGIPDFARVYTEGHEASALISNKPTVCNFHGWISNLDEVYPEIFTNCSESNADSKTWCTTSEYCEWTNNPVMFKKSFYINSLLVPYQTYWNDLRKSDPNAREPLFENWARYDSNWTTSQYVIALPKGLFQHWEIGEESFFNTIYTPWRRLNTDVNGAIRDYFRTYVQECGSSQFSHSYGRLVKNLFPTYFVKKFHFAEAFEVPEPKILQNIQNELRKQIIAVTQGSSNWRKAWQDFSETNLKSILSQFPVDPADMTITFVSSFFARRNISKQEAASRISKFCLLLNFLRNYNIVIFAATNQVGKLKNNLIDNYNWTDHTLKSIQFIVAKEDRLVADVLKSKIEILRGHSIDTDLITPFLIREVSRGTFEERSELGKKSRSTHFVWINSNLEYNIDGLPALSKNADHTLRGNLWLNPMVVGRNLDSREQLSTILGDMNDVMGRLGANPRIISGNVLGGSRLALENFVGYYEILLTWSLKNGLNTSKECLATIISNINGIEIPIKISVFEDFNYKNMDSDMFSYAKNCSISQ